MLRRFKQRLCPVFLTPWLHHSRRYVIEGRCDREIYGGKLREGLIVLPGGKGLFVGDNVSDGGGSARKLRDAVADLLEAPDCAYWQKQCMRCTDTGNESMVQVKRRCTLVFCIDQQGINSHRRT